MYQKGEGVPKDLAKAKELFAKAEEHGGTNALRALAYIYESTNPAKAIQLNQRLADMGDPRAS